MSPEDITLIRDGAADVVADADTFAAQFYATLFELAPAARPLFPDDLTQQRRKLMAELRTLIGLAVETQGANVERFVSRCREMGRRHVSYGAADGHYAIVGAALLSALADTIPAWDDAHERAWTTLYRLVSDAMREGAHMAQPV